jgi:hypothetical protein
MEASYFGYPRCVELLLEANAKVDLQNLVLSFSFSLF